MLILQIFLHVLTVLTVKQVRVCASIDSFVTVTCHVRQKWVGKTGDLSQDTFGFFETFFT